MSGSIFIASDHAGFELKKLVVEILRAKGQNVEDLGCDGTDSVDYPDYAQKMGKRMQEASDSVGILLCGSGLGMSMAVNRYAHARGALCRTPENARLARAHNDANILVLAGREIKEKEVPAILDMFFSTAFEGGRHERRIKKMGMGQG